MVALELRILCTKCVRIVRVRWSRESLVTRDVIVATECCRRLYGYVPVSAINERPGDITTNDLRDLDHHILERTVIDIENVVAQQRAEIEAIRWVLAG